MFRHISARLSHAPVGAGGLLWVTARPNISDLEVVQTGFTVQRISESRMLLLGGVAACGLFQASVSSCGVLRAHLLLQSR